MNLANSFQQLPILAILIHATCEIPFTSPAPSHPIQLTPKAGDHVNDVCCGGKIPVQDKKTTQRPTRLRVRREVRWLWPARDRVSHSSLVSQSLMTNEEN
jgi:hypothetical protein